LLAPTTEVAGFVEGTYTFDTVRITPVTSERTATGLHVRAEALTAEVAIGSRSPLGWALRAVPTPVARSRWWCTLTDPIARVALRGVRTRGTAGNGRHEYYGATDAHRLLGVRARLGDQDLGDLADVWPPVRFGFSSTPRVPSIVAVTTTIREAPTAPVAWPGR
jgi:hypothetical protein